LIWFRQPDLNEHGFSNAHHYSEHFSELELFHACAVAWGSHNGETGDTQDHRRDALHPARDDLVSLEAKGEMIMRYVVLWALGVPISGLIVLHLLGMV
jgi:hypothetical protein